MGGGGGGTWHNINPEVGANRIRDAERNEVDSAFETTVNDFLSGQLADFNDRDTETIQSILDDVKGELSDSTSGTVELLFGGSVAKHTYVDGLSDVDALVFLNRTDLADRPPGELLEAFKEILQRIRGLEFLEIGKLAATLRLRDQTVQLLPALRVNNEIRIGAVDGTSWQTVSPDVFAEALTSSNKLLGGKLIPTIKLTKAIISTLPPQQQVNGYHVEAVAVEAFRGYNGPKSPRSMVEFLIERMVEAVKTPIPDITGQSKHLDDYMGREGDVRRRATSMGLERLLRRMKNADGMRSIPEWKRILGEE